MEPEIHTLWEFAMWGFGICSAGFFLLLGMLFRTSLRMSKPVNEIRDALIGTFEKPGLITRHYKLESDIEEIKKKCKIHQQFIDNNAK